MNIVRLMAHAKQCATGTGSVLCASFRPMNCALPSPCPVISLCRLEVMATTAASSGSFGGSVGMLD